MCKVIYFISLFVVASQLTIVHGNLAIIDFPNSQASDLIETLCTDESLTPGTASSVMNSAIILGPVAPLEDYKNRCHRDTHQAMIDFLIVASNRIGSANCDLMRALEIVGYHNKHIMAPLNRQVNGPAVGLRNFFMRYATNLASKCSSLLETQLESASKTLKESDVKTILSGTMQKRYRISHFLYWFPRSKIENYEDFVFPWIHDIKRQQALGKLALNYTGFAEEIEVATIPSFHVDYDKFVEAKEVCKDSLRDVYKDTVLPVMILIDIGYGAGLKRLDSDLIKSWYEITQICELLLKHSFTVADDGTLPSASGGRWNVTFHQRFDHDARIENEWPERVEELIERTKLRVKYRASLSDPWSLIKGPK